MMTENKYPILEFDDEKVAKLNPTVFADEKFGTDKLVITFFPEIMEKSGRNPLRSCAAL